MIDAGLLISRNARDLARQRGHLGQRQGSSVKSPLIGLTAEGSAVGQTYNRSDRSDDSWRRQRSSVNETRIDIWIFGETKIYTE